jgi:hypothetical protein
MTNDAIAAAAVAAARIRFVMKVIHAITPQ